MLKNDQVVELVAYIDKAIEGMQINGEFWATVQCQLNKVATLQDAYVLGFVSSCLSMKEYISVRHLDKPATRCYTRRKAHKK